MYDMMMDLQLSKQRREEIEREVHIERLGKTGQERGGSGSRWLAALVEELEIDVTRLKRSFGNLKVSRKRKEKTPSNVRSAELWETGSPVEPEVAAFSKSPAERRGAAQR